MSQTQTTAPSGAPQFNPALSPEDVRITAAASAKLAELFAETDDEIEAIRVYVSGGGCGGMTYGMTFSDTRSPFDTVFDGEGFKVYVDSVALNYLRGVEIDYVERPTGATFVFNNVFASTGGSGVCGGCGAAGGGCA